jgi:hypothetical protein
MMLPTSAGKVTAMIDPHSVAALLKRWFRELPEPLCTMEMYDMWMAAASINDPPTKLLQVKKVLSFCPQSNQILIRYLAAFLRSFSDFSEITKMTAVNLSICFAPNLLRAPDTIGLLDQIEESPIATSLLVLFIEHFDYIFETLTSKSAMNGTHNEATNDAKTSSSLTSNLPPPPPMSTTTTTTTGTQRAYEPAPTPPPKKPTPKYMAIKKAVGVTKPSSPLPLDASYGDIVSPSPPLSPLPPPIDSSVSPDSDFEFGTTNISLPPPVTAPKPKIKSSSDGKNNLRKSAKKNRHNTELGEFSAQSCSAEPSPSGSPSMLPPPPLQFHEDIPPPSLPPVPENIPAIGSPTMKKIPPPRPSSAAPNFV